MSPYGPCTITKMPIEGPISMTRTGTGHWKQSRRVYCPFLGALTTHSAGRISFAAPPSRTRNSHYSRLPGSQHKLFPEDRERTNTFLLSAVLSFRKAIVPYLWYAPQRISPNTPHSYPLTEGARACRCHLRSCELRHGQITGDPSVPAKSPPICCNPVAV